MELNYDKEVSDAHLAAAGWGMDAFNHSNPFESHVIYVRDYRSDNTRLFTIRQDEFDVIRVPAHQPIGPQRQQCGHRHHGHERT